MPVPRFLLALVAVAALALPASAPATVNQTFVFEGRGWGHGVGMGQYGAHGFALSGWGFRRILGHYYPGTRLVRLPARNVRVLLGDERAAAEIRSRKPFRFRDAAGRRATVPAGRYRLGPTLRLRVRGRRVALTAPVRFEPGAAVLALDGRAYRGSLVVHRVGRRLQVVNDLPLERYLRGVVPWEMPHEWHVQALAAQAVAARSYALATLDPGRSWDLVADTRDQVYGGVRAEQDSTNRAVGLTHGLVVTWRGRIALTVYSSTTGGRTAALPHGLPGNSWLPYLVPRPDPYDRLSPYHRWGPVQYGARKLARRLGVPEVKSLELVRNSSRRVSEVRVTWPGGSKTVDGRTFQRSLELRSTWFSLRGAEEPVKQPPGKESGELRGWTVVLKSVPEGGRAEANQVATRARRANLPSVRVLVSSRYGTMRPGYLVVASGRYGNPRQAAVAAAQARRAFPAAYPRRLGG